MTAPSHGRVLALGLALILITNAVALGGAAYNRSGEPESSLPLTQRELRLPYSWGFEKENSGVSLELQWRVPKAQSGSTGPDDSPYVYGNTPAWLDDAKLAELGILVPPARPMDRAEMRSKRLRAKEVLLVLELDGPAYQRVLQSARDRQAATAAAAASHPGEKEFEARDKAAREQLATEESTASRLFVVDAGFDVASLRARYPDIHRYAIVRGQLQVRQWRLGKERRPSVFIGEISARTINVPLAYVGILGAVTQNYRQDGGAYAGRYTFTVAFGKRFEPWILSAQSK